jgi:phage shock protein A
MVVSVANLEQELKEARKNVANLEQKLKEAEENKKEAEARCIQAKTKSEIKAEGVEVVSRNE